MEEKKSIKEYFKGKNIFLTGGSGFVGKSLIEKLLRSCPDIGNIYILLRPKKGKELYDRVEHILTCPLFNLLKETYPENLKKIIPINGDVNKLGFAISEEDKQTITNEVHVFFHSAASVRFDDFLKNAITTNIRGAREAALLALDMKQIEVFVHVSTAYCNVVGKKHIEEILYPPHGDWRKAIRVAEKCDPQIIEMFSQKYIGQFPNTYTYTKQLAEHCVNDILLGKIPTVICRPSVVINSILEPVTGWVDNFNGPLALVVAGVTGLLRTTFTDPELEMEYTYVDNLAKLLIVVAWNKAITRHSNEISIYHGSNNGADKFKVGELYISYAKRLCWDVPFENKIWFPAVEMTINWYYYFINVLIFHMIPAFFLDRLLSIAGLPPRIFKLQRKIYIASMALLPFTTNQWQFHNPNIHSLFRLIPPKEIEAFNFIIRPFDDISRYDFFRRSMNHLRVHMLKENKNITEQNQTRTIIMFYLDKLTKAIFFGIAIWVIFFKINIIKICWEVLYNL